jgi:hypothetical protein
LASSRTLSSVFSTVTYQEEIAMLFKVIPEKKKFEM